MKARKYLLCLVPLAACLAISLAMHLRQPADPHDELYLYRSPEMLAYLRNAWLLIGVIVSGVLLVCVAIDDAFRRGENAAERRRILTLKQHRDGDPSS